MCVDKAVKFLKNSEPMTKEKIERKKLKDQGEIE